MRTFAPYYSNYPTLGQLFFLEKELFHRFLTHPVMFQLELFLKIPLSVIFFQNEQGSPAGVRFHTAPVGSAQLCTGRRWRSPG